MIFDWIAQKKEAKKPVDAMKLDHIDRRMTRNICCTIMGILSVLLAFIRPVDQDLIVQFFHFKRLDAINV
jgi:hypothetical protein